MTAEVVIANKSAIALAADSKVTISGSRMSKTYDTVNKLFTLSKVHPVGIMIYGNADFMGYPWETLIKNYRINKNSHCEDTIQDWSNDFQKFVSSFGEISEDDQINNIISLADASFSSVIDEADNISFSRGVSVGTDDYKDILKECFLMRSISITDQVPWISGSKSKKFIKKFGDLVDKIRDSFVGEFKDSELTDAADAYISAQIMYQKSSPLASGIVIAGFGDKEFFPSYVSLECDGYVGESLKIWKEGDLQVCRQKTGAMRAFAQGEMVQRFMTGLDPNLGATLMTAFGEVLNQNCQEVLHKYGLNKFKNKITEEKVSDAVHKSMSTLINNVSEYTQRAYSSPIVQMISLLPKDELANLAESLVGLTSLKRRVSSDVETVGGAIDVALISKGDGFVWVKRKNYFPGELNHQFLQNYMRSVD